MGCGGMGDSVVVCVDFNLFRPSPPPPPPQKGETVKPLKNTSSVSRKRQALLFYGHHDSRSVLNQRKVSHYSITSCPDNRLYIEHELSLM